MKKNLLKKLKEIEKDDSYLVTVTVFDKKSKGRKLDTFIFINDFPFAEFEGTKKIIGELIDNAEKRK